ncbi:MAG TPA: ester cyclase [Nocardioidaceae bacterium]|jgi:steroid delta-isomerase-like uncharacterized protein
MADNATLVRSLMEAWNERDFDKLADSIATDGKIVVVGSGQTFTGPDGSRAFDSMWADAFPDGRITLDRLIESGAHVVVEYTGRGTHTGTLRTAMGEIPATGRSLTLQLCDVYEITEGKIQSQHSYFDTGSLMAQLGLTGQPASQTQ